ncbi:MAG: response regulator [Verrucomicrobia bacterium CG_4_10_14_3_um_filter_43_23]|nr:MAG: response regulator [Verrucomicrobia bacterium CG1_02_43_26]PIP59093.1 MAG: response regulator [Verrucomicrobia bacterium CG22_combo_CG10-13_8_21_14_all_43_17]PIX58230.1 MAG: response regulator [Verrucomicrobia bacterium CG_4_10_14_3_um_filter_43_23]PIY62352.1 MAG: response regulator [Verrucomicrobia bacterium CG_4_10_14_0_8_um_filter_43_34]PJA44070.1 MAG: response regulator [Verrucomicrobia bacterium CG_4_9_14_3_um_filter_43_20]
MRLKILTVDDSKAVRIIVKKAFVNYDVTIIEAANGVEGLAAASKEVPDLILLDVTMPIMDGVEMLTKIKSDSNLKAIPIIMLTAEAGRENVLKIAKIGIRDYIVKPFKEDVLIEKVSRVVNIRLSDSQKVKQKTIDDVCNILVVDDKPVIVKQMEDYFAGSPWKVTSASTTGEALDKCQGLTPDLIIINLALPEEGAFNLFRILRSNLKTKYVPVFGLAVKTAMAEQQQAQQTGFTAIVAKPIDFEDLENKIAKSLKLDTSPRYFKTEGSLLIIRFPKSMSPIAVSAMNHYLTPKISEAVDAGLSRAIFDIHELNNIDVETIKILLQAMEICNELTLPFAMVGTPALAEQCQSYEESKDWTFFNSIDDAKENLVSA